jgi:hypothetical protein
MVGNIQRNIARSVIILASIAMLTVAVYKSVWLLIGTLAWGIGPLDKFYVTSLVEVPAYFASAVTTWKWPWFAESVAVLTLAVILAWFNPWTIGPLLQRELSLEYVFIIYANVAFIAKLLLRRVEMKGA